MTINFSAAANSNGLPLSRRPARIRIGQPANDNPMATQDREMLNAALRHFAEHGIAAARQARRQAEDAFFAGDREAYRWWLGICRTLDSRMAAKLAEQNSARQGVASRNP